MPHVSVIVPIFNTQGYVGECLTSLKKQTYTDFEVVCVDDGSTDNSLKVAKSAVTDDDRFVFVQRENGGLSAARNTGLEVAKGNFVTFLDSDDCYALQTLERLVEMQEAWQADVVDFSATTFYESDGSEQLHKEDYSYRKNISGVLSGAQIFTEYMARRQYVASACFHLISREIITDNHLQFEEGLLHEDELFTPLLYAYAKRVVFLNEELYLRRMRMNSIMTSKKSVENIRSLHVITQLLHKWLLENAQNYPISFVDAFAKNIAILSDAIFQHSSDISAGELESYIESLDLQDRIDFDLTCRFGPLFADERFREVANSKVYRAGRKLADGMGDLKTIAVNIMSSHKA